MGPDVGSTGARYGENARVKTQKQSVNPKPSVLPIP